MYLGEAEEVAVTGSMTDHTVPMHRVEGTDLYWRSFPIEPGSRWEYRFQIDFERWIPDPRNRLVKAVSEMAWMDYYVRGIGNKFQWSDVLETLEDRAGDPTPTAGR